MSLNKILSIFKKHADEESVIETIEEIMDERAHRGDKVLVEPEEIDLLKNLFALKDLRASQICIPTVDIVGIPLNAKPDLLKKIIINDKFTRLPVYEDTIDNIVGVVHVKDILCALLAKEKLSVENLITGTILFIPGSMRALDLLKELQAKKTQMAILIDEYGATDGLITLEDLLEEIVGEIEDEHDALDTPPVLRKMGKHAIIADARILLDDLQELTGPFLTPDDKLDDVDTVGGFVFQLAGRLPKIGDEISHCSGLIFHITDVDSRHIKQVKITHFQQCKEGS